MQITLVTSLGLYNNQGGGYYYQFYYFTVKDRETECESITLHDSKSRGGAALG